MNTLIILKIFTKLEINGKLNARDNYFVKVLKINIFDKKNYISI